jgi:sirohydrochlorin cobaltochelatase
MTTALVLAGHGSHISPNTAGIVWDYVDKLRSWGVADEITAAFWKEMPDFRGVLSTLKSENVVIVPVFTAQGFFTKQVIPAEMNLTSPLIAKRGGDLGVGICPSYQLGNKTVFYTRTLGEHPSLSKIIAQRIETALHDAKLKPSEVTIAVIGHGTGRLSASQDATKQQAKILENTGKFAQVLDVYLDAEPAINSIFHSSQQTNIIAVPFFLADGSHVSIDVPEALGIQYGDYPAAVEGFQLYYTPPVGTDESVCELILELARESGLPFSSTEAKDWTIFPQFGARELLDKLKDEHELHFGQLVLKFDAVYPIDSTKAHALKSSQSLRKHLRTNPYRPLAYTDDLPRDWVVAIEDPQQIPSVVETVYPQALADWANHQQGKLEIERLESLITRQVGDFRNLEMDVKRITSTIESVCGRCTRQPLWADSELGNLPCPRACNYWLSQYQDKPS